MQELVHLEDFSPYLATGDLLEALSDAPALKSISLGHSEFRKPTLKHKFFADPRIETVVCRGIQEYTVKSMEKNGIPEDVKARVVYETNRSVLALGSMYVSSSILFMISLKALMIGILPIPTPIVIPIPIPKTIPIPIPIIPLMITSTYEWKRNRT